MLQKNCRCYDFVASMKGPVHQLNLIPNRIAAILIRPRWNHNRQISVNAFISARGRHVFQSLMQYQSICCTQQRIHGVSPKAIFLILIIHQQIVMRRITRAEWKQCIRILQSNIAICIRKRHLYLHKTVVPKTTIKRVNPFQIQRGRRRNCIFAPVTG